MKRRLEEPVTRTKRRSARRLTRTLRKAKAWRIRHRCKFTRRNRFDSYNTAKATLRGWQESLICGKRCVVKAVRP